MQGHLFFISQKQLPIVPGGRFAKWYGIEKGRALNAKEVQYIVALIMGWIEQQLTERSHITPYSHT